MTGARIIGTAPTGAEINLICWSDYSFSCTHFGFENGFRTFYISGDNFYSKILELKMISNIHSKIQG